LAWWSHGGQPLAYVTADLAKISKA
jgi:hypothetical protein